ncbi:MAG TPA: cation:proton antiporter [Flavobacteriales bacterium]|nr:cation:proton antiporter [Flavobacteriales bacterium]
MNWSIFELYSMAMGETLHLELPFFANLLFLLVLARVLGEIFEHFRQPAMIGEITAGIILGPSVLQITYFNEELKVFSEMAVFLLVIMAGLEINPKDIRGAMMGKKIWIAILGFVIPIASGFLVGYLFQLDIMISIFLALCISITALPVSIRILIDLGKLHSDIGQKIIAVAIFNDVIALMILGILIDIRGEASTFSEIASTTGVSLLKVLGFLLFVVIAYKIIDRATQKVDFIKEQTDRLLNFLKGKESLFAIIFCFILVFASISESAGLHFIVGAFFGAMLITENLLGKENFKQLEKTTTTITMGFLAPIFFAAIGLEFHIQSLNNIPLLLVVVAISFASKILGGYLGARFSGMSHKGSLTIGIGLNARGIMELVIANIALQEGIIDIRLFSILVVMGLLTTMSTPILLKRAFAWIDKDKETAVPEVN